MKYLLLLSILLVGCGHNPPDSIEVIYRPIPVNCEQYGHIESINPLPVKFVRGVDSKGNEVLGLRGDMYSNLALNSDRSLAYIIEQKKAIRYYEKCIADHNAKTQEEGEPE